MPVERAVREQLAQIVAVDQDAAFVGIVQARQKAANRGLSGANAADDAEGLGLALVLGVGVTCLAQLLGVVFSIMRNAASAWVRVPTTIVLDRRGRVSARVLGVVEPSTLKSLITTVVDEQA